MPWNASDAKGKTKKANTAKKQRQWAAVADSALSRGASDGSAIRQANGVISKSMHAAHKAMRKKKR